MLVYSSSIDLSSRTLRFLTGQLAARRAKIGTRWRRLAVGRQALLTLAHLRCGDTYAQLAAGFGIGIATVYRYIREAVEALAALAPSLAEAMRTIREKAFVILDGTLSADRPDRCGLPVLLRETQAPRHEHPGPRRSVRTPALGLARPARIDPRPHCCPTPRNHRRAHRGGPEVLGGQGVSRRRRACSSPVPRSPSEEVEAPPQHQSRQDPMRRRTSYGHAQGLASSAEAPLQHQPDHRHGEGRPRPSPRVNVRLENAQ